MQNASKFIDLFIFVNVSARQGIPARLEAHQYPSKVRILLKIADFLDFTGFQSVRARSCAHHMLVIEIGLKSRCVLLHEP